MFRFKRVKEINVILLRKNIVLCSPLIYVPDSPAYTPNAFLCYLTFIGFMSTTPAAGLSFCKGFCQVKQNPRKTRKRLEA